MLLSCACTDGVKLPAPPPRATQDAPSAGGAFDAVGIALTPRRFPRHTPDDVRGMFEMGSDLGSAAVFIYQWSQGDFLQVARTILGLSRQYNLTPLVGLSPTTLEDMRGKLDIPGDVRQQAGSRVTFRNDVVQQAFVRDAVALARLGPAYLCLATEINLLALKDLQEYLAFVATYKKAYAEVKKVAPDTKVFVSFQWDFVRMMGVKEPDRVAEHRKLIDVFRPELDVIALSTYPSGIYRTPAEMPADYYTRALEYLRPGEETIVMEIGWPTGGSGSPQEQAAFIERLPSLFSELRPRIIAWSLLHDIQIPLLGDELFTTGLVTAGGTRKPGYEAFKALGSR